MLSSPDPPVHRRSRGLARGTNYMYLTGRRTHPCHPMYTAELRTSGSIPGGEMTFESSTKTNQLVLWCHATHSIDFSISEFIPEIVGSQVVPF